MSAALHFSRRSAKPNLADVHAVVAPLTGQLRIELDPIDRDGWIDQDDLGDPETGPLADLNARFVAAGFGATRRAVAASLLLRFGWAAGFSIGAWLACGVIVRIEAFAIKFSGRTLVEGVWIKRASIEKPRSHIAGQTALARELRNFTDPLITRQHEWSRFSRYALWAMATSSWAAQFAAIGSRLGRENDAVNEARLVIGNDPEIAATAPDLYEVRAGENSQTCQKRAACCLYFKGPRKHFCASCPIIPGEERLARNQQWVRASA